MDASGGHFVKKRFLRSRFAGEITWAADGFV